MKDGKDGSSTIIRRRGPVGGGSSRGAESKFLVKRSNVRIRAVETTDRKSAVTFDLCFWAAHSIEKRVSS